jgi:hypothetical protein
LGRDLGAGSGKRIAPLQAKAIRFPGSSDSTTTTASAKLCRMREIDVSCDTLFKNAKFTTMTPPGVSLR